jgi:hypothetical protein
VKNKKGNAANPESWKDKEFLQIGRVMEFPEDYDSLQSVLEKV